MTIDNNSKGHFTEALKSKTSLYLGTLLIGIGTVFSDWIIGNIKSELNKADMRQENFVKISEEYSQYLYASEIVIDINKNQIRERSHIIRMAGEYNKIITELRKKEYSNFGIINKYWGKKESEKYWNLVLSVRSLDSSIHLLNPVAEKIFVSKDSLIQYTPDMINVLNAKIPVIENKYQQTVERMKELMGKL